MHQMKQIDFNDSPHTEWDNDDAENQSWCDRQPKTFTPVKYDKFVSNCCHAEIKRSFCAGNPVDECSECGWECLVRGVKVNNNSQFS